MSNMIPKTTIPMLCSMCITLLLLGQGVGAKSLEASLESSIRNDGSPTSYQEGARPLSNDLWPAAQRTLSDSQSGLIRATGKVVLAEGLAVPNGDSLMVLSKSQIETTEGFESAQGQIDARVIEP